MKYLLCSLVVDMLQEQKYQVFMPDFFEGKPVDINDYPPDTVSLAVLAQCPYNILTAITEGKRRTPRQILRDHWRTPQDRRPHPQSH